MPWAQPWHDAERAEPATPEVSQSEIPQHVEDTDGGPEDSGD
jgi:hypothetical protein